MEDVPQEIPNRDKNALIQSTDGRERYTFQLLPDADYAAQSLVHHNSDAFFSENVDDKPSPLLLDFWYGCAAMKAWGRPIFHVFTDMTDNIYYPKPNNKRDKDDDGDEDNDGDQTTPKKKIAKQNRERERRLRRNANKKAGEMSMAEAGDFILALRWMAAGKKWPTKEDQDKVQHQRSVDKVSEWQARQLKLGEMV